jgi:hypothetical protein
LSLRSVGGITSINKLVQSNSDNVLVAPRISFRVGDFNITSAITRLLKALTPRSGRLEFDEEVK